MTPTMVCLLLVAPALALASLDMDAFSPDLFAKDELTELYARDSEKVGGPIAFGHKFMTGGAGEGSQKLADGEFEPREQVRTDSALPAYCEPPNPCPVGFTSEDGCTEQFDNTAEFSRNYQASQQCMCDEEHMFSCPKPMTNDEHTEYAQDMNDALEQLLDKNGIDSHSTLIAKKFHQKRTPSADGPR